MYPRPLPSSDYGYVVQLLEPATSTGTDGQVTRTYNNARSAWAKVDIEIGRRVKDDLRSDVVVTGEVVLRGEAVSEDWRIKIGFDTFDVVGVVDRIPGVEQIATVERRK